MHRRVMLSLLGAILVAMLAVAGAQSRSQAGTVNIGWSGDKSGPTVASQGPALDGLRAYFKMVNDAGGVKGNKINLIEQDDAYNVAKEVGIVKCFINDDKVVARHRHRQLVGLLVDPAAAERVEDARPRQPGHAEDQHLPLPALHVPGQLQLRRPGRGRARVHDDAREDQEPQGRQGRHRRHRGGVRPGVDRHAEGRRSRPRAVSPVTQTLPAAIVNADVAAQAFQDAGVKMILMHHSIAGGIAMERSIAKYGINVPVSGSYGVTQDLLWTTAPYDATKNFVGTNCYTPLVDSKTPQGKLALASGQEGRRLGGLARSDELHARLGQRRDHRAGAQEHHGPGHDGLDEEGPREDQEPQHGRPLAADQPVAEVPHGDPAGASDDLQLEPQEAGSGRDVRPVVEVHHQHPGGSRHVREAKRGK